VFGFGVWLGFGCPCAIAVHVQYTYSTVSTPNATPNHSPSNAVDPIVARGATDSRTRLPMMPPQFSVVCMSYFGILVFVKAGHPITVPMNFSERVPDPFEKLFHFRESEMKGRGRGDPVIFEENIP